MDTETRERIARLETEVASLRRGRARRAHWLRRLPVAAVALLVALVPLSMLAAGPFDDLTGGVHDRNIELIYEAGITKGCVPNQSYCPTGYVTREEMASFLARTAGLGENRPVANAKTAINANMLGGVAANQYQLRTDPVPLASTASYAVNAGSLGNRPSSDYVTADSPLLASSRVAAGGSDLNSPSEFDSTYRPVATTSIVAPRNGFIVVFGTAAIYSVSGATVQATVTVDGQQPGGVNQFSWLSTAAPLTPNSLTASGVVPVVAGEHTVSIVVKKYSGSQVGPFPGNQITALFVPFDGNGNAP